MSKHVIAAFGLISLIVPLSLPAQQKVDPAKEKTIRRLIEITGTTKVAQEMMATTSSQMRPLLDKSLPENPHKQEIIDTFIKRFLERATAEGLTSRIVPIYDRHFSQEELEGLIQFYESPLGKHSIEVFPKIVQESQAVGAEWGRELGPEVMKEVLREVMGRDGKK